MARRSPVRLRAGTATSLRRMTASTMVDLALVFLRSPRAAGARGEGLSPSGAQEAFDLAFGPGQGLVHRLALQMAGDHLGLDRLGVDLGSELWWVRRRCGRQDLGVVRVWVGGRAVLWGAF